MQKLLDLNALFSRMANWYHRILLSLDGSTTMHKFIVQWYSHATGWYDVKEVARDEAKRIINRYTNGERVVKRFI